VNDLVPLPAGTIACAPGGRTTAALPEDSAELEAVEAFRDFLRIAPPPRTTNGPLAESQASYVERIGVERWTGWRFLCVNDPGLRSYVEGGEWL